jgi:hypothetical protein
MDQLEQAISAASSGDEGWRPFAESLATGLWEAVGRGDLGAPGRILERLDALGGWADDHLPTAGTSAEEAAREIDRLHRWLESAGDALRVPTLEVGLKRPSSVERAVLTVLWDHRGRALTRGEVHGAMPKETRPTAPRVSQVLESLREGGLLMRIYGSGRGAKEVAHYQLWETGEALCARVGIGAPAAEVRPEGRRSERVRGRDGKRRARLQAPLNWRPSEPVSHAVIERANRVPPPARADAVLGERGIADERRVPLLDLKAVWGRR